MEMGAHDRRDLASRRSPRKDGPSFTYLMDGARQQPLSDGERERIDRVETKGDADPSESIDSAPGPTAARELAPAKVRHIDRLRALRELAPGHPCGRDVP